MASSCNSVTQNIEVYETSESGNKMTKRTDFVSQDKLSTIVLDASKEFQTITGFGGAFTESSAYLLTR